MRPVHLVPAFTVLGTLALGACGTGTDADVESGPSDPPITTPATDTPATDAAAAADVPAILQFTAPLVGGGDIDASALAGKPTVFWFWAPT